MELGLERKFDTGNRTYYDAPVYNTRRLSHAAVFGKTGVGKSTALERWAIDDILNGDCTIFFDFHGTSVDTILKHIPEAILFSPAEFPIAYNPLYGISEERASYVASTFLDTVKAAWHYDTPTPDIDMFVYAGVRALLDVPGGTLFGLKYLISSERYRARVIHHVRDPVIRDFWETDFAETIPEPEQRRRTLSTLNKMFSLIADPHIRHCIGQYRSRLDLNDIISRGRVLLIKLPQGQLGIEKASLVAALLLSDLHHALLSRKAGGPVHIFIDECHHLDNATLREMLSGIRKFDASLTLATQYTSALSRETFEAIIGNVGTIVAFQLGMIDAAKLQPLFRIDETHTIDAEEPLEFIPPYHAYVRMGRRKHFLAMPETTAPELGRQNHIRHLSRTLYSTQRAHVEARLRRFIERT